MATDDERRRIAAALREYASFDHECEDEEEFSVDCADWGERVINLLDCGDTEEECYAYLADLIEPQPITGDTSDGYHTSNELYDHRAKLFSVIVRCFKDRAWKSKLHHDGTMCEGMFIVGIETPQGQATYHYDIDPYWDMFDCKELDRAPEWDGHTPEQAISRIASLRPSCDRDAEYEAWYNSLSHYGSAQGEPSNIRELIEEIVWAALTVDLGPNGNTDPSTGIDEGDVYTDKLFAEWVREASRLSGGIDRHALLALADEMEEFGNLPIKHPGIRVLHNDDFSRELGYARRIREAVGA